MPRGSEYQGPPEALDQYRTIIDGVDRDVEVKGAKNPYTSANGHMFSFLDPDGSMAIRLPDDLRDDFLERYESGPVIQYGRVMREYVSVPHDVFIDASAATPWIEASFDWILTLPPK